MNAKSNISIKTEVFVDRVVLEASDNGMKRATGVQLQGSDGRKLLVKARKGVIVSGGSFGSPAMLLRSGIGPKEELQRLGVQSEVVSHVPAPIFPFWLFFWCGEVFSRWDCDARHVAEFQNHFYDPSVLAEQERLTGGFAGS